MKELIRQKKTWERLMNNLQKEMKILNESGNYDKDISEWIRYKCMSIEDKVKNIQFRIDNKIDDEMIYEFFLEKVGLGQYSKREDFFEDDGKTLIRFCLDFSQNGYTCSLSYLASQISSAHSHKILPIKEFFDSNAFSKRRAIKRIKEIK